jgi:hypothetical protein
MSVDCLVIKIQEYIDNKLDTTLYIFYDKNEETYIIRGKRSIVLEEKCPAPYSFSCKYASDLLIFINCVICKKSKISYTLYNYNDLPYESSDIDFEYLQKVDDNSGYELAGYDNQKYSKKNIENYLKIIKSVFNYY